MALRSLSLLRRRRSRAFVARTRRAVLQAETNKRHPRFSWFFETGWPRLSIPPFASEFNNLGWPINNEKKRNRELHFFSDLGLLAGVSVALLKVKEELAAPGFSGKVFASYGAL